MSFLTLNGYPVSVKEGGLEEIPIEAKGQSRVFAGTMRKQRVALKRGWRVTTIPMIASEATLLEQILLGLGDAWSFDGHAFSAKGLLPTTTGQFQNPERGSDGLYTVGGARFGGGIQVADGVTNLLTSNQATVATDLTGFAALAGAALLRNTQWSWQGVGCVRVSTTAVAGDGVRTTGTADASATSCRASVWVMSFQSFSVTVYMRNATTATNGTVQTKALTPGKWVRFDVGTVAHNATDLLEVRAEDATGGGAGHLFYCDGFMLVRDSTTVSPPWVDGSSANVAPTWTFPITTRELTINFWSTMGNAGRPLSLLTSADANRLLILNSPGNVSVSFNTVGGGETTAGTACWTDQYSTKMITVVASYTAPQIKIYIDGVLALSHTAATAPLWADGNAVKLAVGHVAGSNKTKATVDDLAILPYAAPAAMISGWFALGKSLAVLPRIWLGGDAVHDAPVLVYPELDSAPFVPHNDTTGFQSAGRSLSFGLEEA